MQDEVRPNVTPALAGRNADPAAAARKLLDLVRASIAESELPYAHTGRVNSAFLRAGGSVDDYSAGMDFAAAQKWFESTDLARGLCCCRQIGSGPHCALDVRLAPNSRHGRPVAPCLLSANCRHAANGSNNLEWVHAVTDPGARHKLFPPAVPPRRAAQPR